MFNVLILAHDHLELRGYGRVHLVLSSCSQVTRIILRLDMKLFITFLAFQFLEHTYFQFKFYYEARYKWITFWQVSSASEYFVSIDFFTLSIQFFPD